jgi:hypothetical protein
MTITIPAFSKTIVLTKAQLGVLAVFGLVLFSGGVYTASTLTQDPYKAEIQQRTLEVDNDMRTVSASSSMYDLKQVQDELRLQAIWALRTQYTLTPAQLTIETQFMDHLNACNAILRSYSPK